MRFSLPAVGVVFDLEVLEHGADAIELFMKHTDPKKLAYCVLASGDVQRPPSEIVKSHFDYCVAVSGTDVSTKYVRELFGRLDILGLAPKPRKIIEQPILDSLGLTEDGRIDGQGRLVTEEWYRIVHDRCKKTAWGYAPWVINCELSAELHVELDELQRLR